MKKPTPPRGRKSRAAKANRPRHARPARPSRASRKPVRAVAHKPVRAVARKPVRAVARKPAVKTSGRKSVVKPAAKPALKATKPAPPPPAPPAPPPIIRKGLPVSKVSLRRPGRPLHLGPPRPVIKSIIVYTADQKPRNDYPRRIVSPPLPSACCTDVNRLRIGKMHEEFGRNYYYKMCKVCGHTVKYYFNLQSELDSPKFRRYYEWKKSVFH